jgi:hypothetical protein
VRRTFVSVLSIKAGRKGRMFLLTSKYFDKLFLTLDGEGPGAGFWLLAFSS